MMPRVDILAADIHHLAHVLDDVDGVDYNHNVRRVDEAVVVVVAVRVHTYVVVVDNMDCDDVASPHPAYVVVPVPDVWMVEVAYRRACAYHCRVDEAVPAWDTPCDVVASVS